MHSKHSNGVVIGAMSHVIDQTALCCSCSKTVRCFTSDNRDGQRTYFKDVNAVLIV